MPIYLKEATVAIEDKNFYKHHGFDLIAIARAFIINLRNDEISQGASTITQQLARTIFLSQDQKYIRKIKEIILAIEIEKRFTKDEILEMYLNNIPYGSVAYGVSAASEIYFDKNVKDINLLESVHLAAHPKAPTDYSPFGTNKQALEKRSEMVIKAMHDNDLISQAEFDYAMNQKKPKFVKSRVEIRAPHFVFYILDELEKKYGQDYLRRGGLNIFTSLDLSLQEEAERVVREWGEKNEQKYGAGNASLVAVDPSSGEILVMVGSRDYFDEDNGAFNVSTSLRQPGSSFKPYVYAAGIANGLSVDAYITDNRFNFAKFNYGVDYIPRNYDGKYHGQVTVRKALAGSLNIPAVKILVNTGIDKTIDLAESMGLTTLGDRNRFGPSLALGGGEVKLLEHTAALGTFGNEGRRMPLISIMKITDREGDLTYEKPEENGVQVIDKNTAYAINSILSDAEARQYVFGKHSKLEIPGVEVAAKTGTTQEARDAWTIGYTPNLAVGVWSGNNDNQPMFEGANGYVVATPIWREFMTLALDKFDKKDFLKPSEDSDDIILNHDLAKIKEAEIFKEEIVENNLNLSIAIDNPQKADLISIDRKYFSLE
jgi:1A family penicillin-binding protein